MDIQRLKQRAAAENNWQDLISALEEMDGENRRQSERLESLESTVAAMRERLDHYESIGGAGGAVAELSARVEALEARPAAGIEGGGDGKA